MKRILAFFVLCAFPVLIQCRERGENKEYDLKKHEISLSGAIYPGRFAFGPYSIYYDILEYKSIEDIYKRSRQYAKEKTTNSWFLNYTYNFNKVLAFQAGISYEGRSYEYYSRDDNKRVWGTDEHFITPTVALRVSWLNRQLVRLYSGVEAGVSLNICRSTPVNRNHNYIAESYSFLFAGQLTALGVSVGKKVFGFAEVGIGSRYVGGCLGVGYRF